MKKNLIDIVNTLPSYCFNQSAEINWVKIVQLKSDVFMGISQRGEWIVANQGTFWEIKTAESYWRVFVLLERPLREIRQQVSESFISFHITDKVDDVFPFAETVRAAFEVGTTYWAELAFSWYDELPYSEKESFKDILVRIVENKIGSQKFRHKAMKELRKICPQSEYVIKSRAKYIVKRVIK